jgi:hypothetical protein
VIVPVALELLAKLRRERRCAARLIGIALSHLAPAERPRQLALFETEAGKETERDRKVAATVDAIAGRFGRKAIASARVLASKKRPDR